MKVEKYWDLPKEWLVSPLPSFVLMDRVPVPEVPMGLRLMRRSSSSVSTTEDFVIESLADHYSFPSYGDVRNFLKIEPQVASLLFAAREAIDTHFGKDTLATLRLSRGSDSAFKNCQELLIIIRSFRTAEETIAQLENFDNVWLNENVPSEVRLKILFMVEFA